MKDFKKLILLISTQLILLSCNSTEKYKQNLRSDNVTAICEACYELGKLRDTSAIKLLLTGILDPRVSNDLRFKGMSVAQCRLRALKKISNIDVIKKENAYIPDTAAVNFYLDWALKKGYLKNKNEVDINYNK
jgi:hypothetical protein